MIPQQYFILLTFFISNIKGQIENDLEELAVDEWPIDEDTDQVNQYTIYEDNNDNNIIEEEEGQEEEEDDVDNDDYEEEEEDTINEDNLNNTDMNDNNDINNNDINDEDLLLSNDEDDILVINEGEFQPFLIKATSPLQQQEEQLLNDIDQNIISTLENAIDTIKQDKPIRYVPVQLPTPNSTFSNYIYWFIGLLCIMILFFTWKKSKKHAFQEQLLPINDKKKRVKKEWV